MLFPKTFVAFYSDLLIPTVGDYRGFPGGSDGEESACNAEDLDLIPGLGRSPEKGKAIHSRPWSGEFHGLHSPRGSKESDTTEQLSPFTFPRWR